MDIVKNIICLDNNTVSVIRFRANKLEFVKKDGEVVFPVTVDFWEWWKRVVSYIENDPVDICFVYDKNYDLLQDNEIISKNIINSEESSWRIEHIKSYFWELKPTYLNLLIVGPEEQEYSLGGDKGVASHRFYTNLSFKSFAPKNSVSENRSSDNLDPVSEDDYSEFARYFIEMIRRERG